MDIAFQPVSLGNSCEAKFQTSRVMQFRSDPEGSPAAFRLRMLPPHRSSGRFGWSIFEWQLTPFRAVCDYLERDFQGIFEREDLVIGPLGCAYNRRFKTHHLHEFEILQHAAGGVLTPELIDEGYEQAREKVEARCEVFRRIQDQAGPFLYVHVCEDFPSGQAAIKLLSLLGARSPEHRFNLLFVGLEDEDSDLSGLAGRVSKAYRPPVSEKPSDRGWEGDDTAWDRALAPFNLAFQDGSLAGGG